jgi:hypothetical protein
MYVFQTVKTLRIFLMCGGKHPLTPSKHKEVKASSGKTPNPKTCCKFF